MEKKCFSKKAPVRSSLSDEELAEKIRRQRAERPSEFVTVSSASSTSAGSYRISSVNEVIAKWL